MSELKTVKEVCEITGLNRKLLYDYKDVVKPAGYSNMGFEGNDGYKLYDEKSIDKLKQIAIFRELGVPRAEIKKRISDINYDSNKLLEEQIIMLKKKKEDIENLIVVAEQLKEMGMKNNVLENFVGINMKNFLEVFKNVKNSDYAEFLENLMLENVEDYSKDIQSVEEKISLIKDDEYDTPEAIATVKEYFRITIEYYGFWGWCLLVMLILSIRGEGTYASEWELTETEAKAFSCFWIEYQENLGNAIGTIIDEYYDVIGTDFSHFRVKEMVEAMMQIYREYMGIKRKEEYEVFLAYTTSETYKKVDVIMDYINNAIRYYCDTYFK